VGCQIKVTLSHQNKIDFLLEKHKSKYDFIHFPRVSMAPKISKSFVVFLNRLGFNDDNKENLANFLKHAEESDPEPWCNDAMFMWTNFKKPIAYGEDSCGNCFLVLRFRNKQEEKNPVTAPEWMSKENQKHDYFKRPFIFWAIMERGGSGNLSGMFHCPRLIDGQECNPTDVLGKCMENYGRGGVHHWRQSDLPMLKDLLMNRHRIFECCEATCETEYSDQ